jgi:hypothetical protein
MMSRFFVYIEWRYFMFGVGFTKWKDIVFFIGPFRICFNYGEEESIEDAFITHNE